MSDSKISQFQTYYSLHGCPLLYVGKPCSVPILTLENNDKWYQGIHLVMPDGTVQLVQDETILLIVNKYPDTYWIDHCYNPRLLYRLAKHVNAEVDERAIEVVLARSIMQLNQLNNFNEPDE